MPDRHAPMHRSRLRRALVAGAAGLAAAALLLARHHPSAGQFAGAAIAVACAACLYLALNAALGPRAAVRSWGPVVAVPDGDANGGAGAGIAWACILTLAACAALFAYAVVLRLAEATAF